MPEVSVNTIIVYEQVILNHGGFYNENVGQYIPPLRGIYVFIVNAVTHSGPSEVLLIHNGQEVSRGFAIANPSNKSGSMMAILALQQLDEVHSLLLQGCTLFGLGFSHWGGFLLATV